MRLTSRLALTIMLGGGGVACSDSSGPAAAGSVTIADGNGQQLPTGTTLPVPLKAAVVGSNGQALAGATVTWTVTAGAATLGGTTSVSDALGAATMSVTLGGTIGPVSIRASVPGATPVTFSATALDPCSYVWAHTFGTTVNGTLAATDCAFGNYYTDFYGVAFGAQQGVTITLSSSTFATWIDLYHGSGPYQGFEGDTVVSTNSVLEAIVAPGAYILAPNSYFEFRTGSYTLSTATRPQTIAGCSPLWVTRGVTITDSVTAGDCVDTDTSGTYYSDAVAIIALTNTVLTIAERSTAFDAFLTLYRFDPTGDSLVLVASNDDSAGVGPNAYLVATAPQNAAYVLFIGTAGAAQTGAYTLAISTSTTVGASRGAARGPTVLRMAPWRMPKGLPKRAWRH